MMRCLVGCLLLSLCTVTLFAQQLSPSTPKGASSGQQSGASNQQAVSSAKQAQPAEPEIVLPPILLKVQDVSKEKIDTPLPEEQAPALPEVDIALPKAQNINLGSAAYEVPVPAQGPGGASITPAAKQGASFFSDGRIGAGMMNHIIGDVTLYKLGNEPRFNIEFAHERLDGYLTAQADNPFHFEAAGAGFFNRTDALTGRLTYSSKDLFNFDTHDFYREVEDGLQGLPSSNPPYSSVDHRFISGSAQGDYTRLAPFTFGGGVGVRSGDLTLSGGPAPKNAQELAATPTIDIGVTLGNFNGRLSAYYGFSRLSEGSELAGSRYQKVGGTLSGSAELPLALTLKGNAGIQWDTSIGWAVPFSLELDGLYKDILNYRVYGGYRVEHPSYFDLWSTYPFLTYGVPLATSVGWYGGASTDWRFGKYFALKSGVEFATASAAVLPTSLNATGLFDFEQGQTTTLGPTLTFSWDPSGPFSLKVGWNGDFLSPGQFVPVSSFNLDAELNDNNGRFGGALTGTEDLFNPFDTTVAALNQIPNISLSGYFRVTNGVTFHINMNDLLSPLMQTGRKTWNTYTDPGFRVTVTTQISL